MELDGITAFVTGASRGIGREIAIAFGEAGAEVALAARSDGIYETAAVIDDPDRTFPVETDVAEEGSVRESIEATVGEFGDLDCLVNNAGIAGAIGPVEELGLEEWERTLRVNLTSAFLCAKHATPHLRESDRGSIVNIASVGGKSPYPYWMAYGVSKAGMISLSRTLSHELADDGVTVNTINPGAVVGDRIERVIETEAEERGVPIAEVRERYESSPLGEMVEPGDVADLAVFLASEEARHVTSQDIDVSSGSSWW